MAATSILQFQSIPEPFQNEIMEASNVNESPRVRHGRGKSFSNKSGRARGLSNATRPMNVINEREASLTKGLTWILRHREDQEIIELNEAGFASCSDLLKWQYMQTLNVTFPEIQALLENNATARQRFSLIPKDSADSDSEEASDWLLGSTQTPKKKTASSTIDNEIMANLEPITLAAENVPEMVVFQTTYVAYPMILSKGSLENASGSYIHCSSEISGDAEVLIYIDVRKALETVPEMHWFQSEGKNSIVTDGGAEKKVAKTLWKKVVGRKNEVGLLWGDGEEVKEVPVGLRGKRVGGGKGAKGRAAGRRSSLDAKVSSEEEKDEEEKAVEAVRGEEE